MNIQNAKEEIQKAVRAYTARTDAGTFRIPVKRQRPLLLIGPPGIGKTAIMEQIARECGIGLVAYTMTHHTRQSAIGLPKLTERDFSGKRYTVTDYTMSEIISSVYEQMEESGCREGILFLDEINCVSETLMPSMLQFLQYKTFGSHRLPEGWVIVAAGNPPAYNRSVREFDTVTLDRVRVLEVKPDLEVWRQYANEKGLHPAVLSFLTLRPERFYVMEPGQKGGVTGRAWEDLSEILQTMEDLKLSVEEELFPQYLQEEDTATEFAFYYRIYERWRECLRPEDIFKGAVSEENTFPSLPFDERLCIVWLLLQALQRKAHVYGEQKKLADSLQYFVGGLTEGPGVDEQITERLQSREKSLQIRKDNGLLEPGEEERELRLWKIMKSLRERVRLTEGPDSLCAEVQSVRETVEHMRADLRDGMGHTAQFVTDTFGSGQELVILLTGLWEHPECRRILEEELPELRNAVSELLDTRKREEMLRKKIQG